MDKILDLIEKEKQRQAYTLMMIPSENYTYPEVRQAVGSFLMHKYAEGYPGKRYYQGMKYVDQIEKIAIERARKLFGVPHANVQPYSGSPANAAVYFALLQPGDRILGLALSHGGHLTHGYPKITFSGKYFQSFQYFLAEEKPYFDFAAIMKMAKKEKPKIIIVGTTAFPRTLPWLEFRRIADSVGAFLLADISHIAGLVAGGSHESPVKYVDVVTTTTHKTLRGPRGALIMVTEKGLEKDKTLAERIDKAVFPGLQGGPHLHTIAGIAIALRKAGTAAFRRYSRQVVINAAFLAAQLQNEGFKLVTDGTDNHLLVLDLRPQKVEGKKAAVNLEEAGIVVNANTVPNDPSPPYRPSGIRLGTPAVTTRGMKQREMKKIAGWISQAISAKKAKLRGIAAEVRELCQKFPVAQ